MAVTALSSPAAPATCEWTEHTSPEGYKYYYNINTGESKVPFPLVVIAFRRKQLNFIPLPVSFACLMSPRRLIFMSIFSWCLAVGEARWANCCWTTAEADPCSYCKLSHRSRFTVAWLLICWWGSQWPFDAPFSVSFSCIEKLCLVSLKHVWWASEWVPHTDL